MADNSIFNNEQLGRENFIYSKIEILKEMTPKILDEKILEYKLNDGEIIRLANRIVIFAQREDLLQVLLDHGFVLTDNLIQKWTTEIFSADAFIEKITGNHIYYYHDNKSLGKRFAYHYCNISAYKHSGMLEKIINDSIDECHKIIRYSYDFNTMQLINKQNLFGYCKTTSQADILKIVMENMNLDFIDFNIFKILIRHEQIDIIKLLVQYGILADRFNNQSLPNLNENYFNQLCELGFEREKLIYWHAK